MPKFTKVLSNLSEPLKAMLHQKMIWKLANHGVGYKSGNYIVTINDEFPIKSLYTIHDKNQPTKKHDFNDWPKNWDKETSPSNAPKKS